MNTDSIFDSNTTALTKDLSASDITSWSDGKRKEYVTLFSDRVLVAQFILQQTAKFIRDKALQKKFISTKHNCDVHENIRFSWKNSSVVGSRNTNELIEIAEQRANLIIDELPSIKKAVQIISPETAKAMDERDKLLKKGQELTDKMEEISEPLAMSDMDQKMTIGDFRELVKERAKKRRAIFNQLDEIGKDGCALEDQINRALYAGLPGLSDAVVSVVRQHVERAIALGQMTRRVNERVMFGDCEAALEMLKVFEKDETQVSDSIKTEFAQALEKLKLIGKKKALKK